MLGIKIKTLKARVVVYFLPILFSLLFIVVAVIYIFAQQKTYESAIDSSASITYSSKIAVEEWINGVINQLGMFSNSTDIKNMEKEKYLDFVSKMAKNNTIFESFFVSDLEGNAVTHAEIEMDISSRQYFKDMVATQETQISNALSSIVSGEPVFVIIDPIFDFDGNLVGCFGATVILKNLSEKINKIKIGESGSLMIVDGVGQTVTHSDLKMVMNFNITESDDEGYEGLSEMGSKMIKGESGYDAIKDPSGSRVLFIYEPIDGTQNWSIGAFIPDTQINELSNALIGIILIGFLIIMVLIVFGTFMVAIAIEKRQSFVKEGINQLADYDLRANEKNTETILKIAESEDDLGKMMQSTIRLKTNLSNLVNTLNTQLKQISESVTDLSSVSQEQLASSEELASQAQTVDENVQDTSAAIEEVTSGVEEVAASAQDVSKNSQELSNEISETEAAVKNGQKELVLQGKRMQTVDAQNKTATELVTTVAEKANNVQQIVNSISSIAEQTNLLALNAAIEAARAGEAGKGFAVVADEIRKLAEESKKASSNIARILNEIDDGASKANDAVKQTVELYKELAEGTKVVTGEFDRINDYMMSVNSRVESLMGVSEEQSASAEEMASAMDNSARMTNEIADQVSQMSTAVEQQTLGAQQVSEAAEKLNTLAEELDEEIKKFKC